jgi:hypothetical protein
MVSTFVMPRASPRETLFLVHAPQRRSTAPATASAETGEQGGVPANKTPRLTVCEVRPNPSFKRRANGKPPGPGRRYAVHFRQPGPGVLPLAPA